MIQRIISSAFFFALSWRAFEAGTAKQTARILNTSTGVWCCVNDYHPSSGAYEVKTPIAGANQSTDEGCEDMSGKQIKCQPVQAIDCFKRAKQCPKCIGDCF